MILVVGDVSSTAACSLVAAKLHIKVTHYEAGLRSRDRGMPEEINRLVTDAITDLYITTSSDASENLFEEGVAPSKVHMLGNLMIDSLVAQLEKAADLSLDLYAQDGSSINFSRELRGSKYAVMTFHRPSNVDSLETLSVLVDQWLAISEKLKVIFPVHPRTQKMLIEYSLMEKLDAADNIFLTGPLSYLEFLKLVSESALVITDSGGIQEETTYLKIPCLTVRPSTERPVTIWEGSNQLIKAHEMFESVEKILGAANKPTTVPKYWDGHAAKRIVSLLEEYASYEL